MELYTMEGNTSYNCSGVQNNATICGASTSVMDIRIIWWIDIATTVLALFFHAVGLYAIHNYGKKSNQVIILTSLSIAEIVGAIYMLINDVIRQVRYRDDMYDSVDRMENVLANTLPPVYQEISFCIYLASAFELLLVSFIMTVDRLICAANPYAYQVHATRRRLKITIYITIAISIFLGLVYSLVPKSKYYILGVFALVAAVQLIVVVITYSVIGYKVRSSMRSRRTNPHQRSVTSTTSESRNIRVKKHYMIPTLIVLTYFIFYLIPLSVQQFVLRQQVLTPNICIIHESLSILLVAGILSDALIYEFLIRDYRDVILKKLSCCS